jgi:hypothetical protein
MTRSRSDIRQLGKGRPRMNTILAARGMHCLSNISSQDLALGSDVIEEFAVALRLHPIEQRFDRRSHRAEDAERSRRAAATSGSRPSVTAGLAGGRLVTTRDVPANSHTRVGRCCTLSPARADCLRLSVSVCASLQRFCSLANQSANYPTPAARPGVPKFGREFPGSCRPRDPATSERRSRARLGRTLPARARRQGRARQLSPCPLGHCRLRHGPAVEN